ncbi:protein NLP9-like isoform X2 [Impatiens glandulifera]|uniref:protein NLP9-like isoform X2 n=1 Tax=Impatiens glandulifera TaxID=253017 RepID=UPI001FB102D7|nr:protein NLP9-like isoform X2 [Impatiens glandulifera]
MEYWASSNSQMDGESSDDFFNSDQDYLNLEDCYDDGWCNDSQMNDHLFANFPSSSSFVDASNFVEQTNPPYNIMTGSYDNMFQQDDDSFFRENSVCRNVSEDENYNNILIPRSLTKPLSEKILKALTLFKDSSRDGVLAQLWVPYKQGDRHFLSTCDQPYLLDETLSGYRDVSRMFTFSAEVKTGFTSGLPGRVFSSKVPEWTSNVGYYNKEEYLRVEHAVNHHIRGSICIPVFEIDTDENSSCCAVLELVTRIEKPDFDQEMENVCAALQAVDLKSTSRPRFNPQCISKNQRAALAEITDVLRVICHAHNLPLALTWIPCSYNQGIGYEATQVQIKGCKPLGPNKRCILCIQVSACYVHDQDLKGFVLACEENYLEEGQGVAGKAFLSNHPFFFADVKSYDIYQYPLVHHARKFNLNSAVAIRLRSTFTGDEDYIIEFFLPNHISGTMEQQILLNNLAGTMQKVCKSLRTVSDTEMLGKKYLFNEMTILESCPVSYVQVNKEVLKRKMPKKRTSVEKNVSFSVLQKYFSGNLKDAAKSLGVCPTTLKRICRQQGISRWPSRKINKVNRSLKRIQTVLDSVQGVDSSMKLDPSTGELVSAQPIPTREPDTGKDFSMTPNFVFGVPSQNCDELPLAANEVDTFIIPDDLKELNQPTSSGMTDSSNGSGSTAQVSSSSTPSFGFGERQNNRIYSNIGGSKITVKATLKGDTVRFKFDPSVAGSVKLYQEIAMRFKLHVGSFELKYLDDEQEWVMLVDNSDLQECLEILDLVGTRTVKFLVRETNDIMGSSSSSNSLMVRDK